MSVSMSVGCVWYAAVRVYRGRLQLWGCAVRGALASCGVMSDQGRTTRVPGVRDEEVRSSVWEKQGGGPSKWGLRRPLSQAGRDLPQLCVRRELCESGRVFVFAVSQPYLSLGSDAAAVL